VIRFVAICSLAIAFIAEANAQKVWIQNGNVCVSNGGESKTLTTSGRDSEPVLSPDGKWIVFVRTIPSKKISTGLGDADATELWQIRADGKEPIVLVRPKGQRQNGKRSGGLFQAAVFHEWQARLFLERSLGDIGSASRCRYDEQRNILFVRRSSSKWFLQASIATVFWSRSIAISSAAAATIGFGCCGPTARKRGRLAKTRKISKQPTSRINLKKFVSIRVHSWLIFDLP